MSPPVDPNRQEAIANQARMPRFAIGNPNVGNIDLGSLLSAKANPNYDPNAPVGGANVPFQETKGVGGFFRRMFGDTANEQNVAAQEQQKAEWKTEDTLAKRRAEKKADLEEEIRLREAGPAERFRKTEERLTKSEETAARERALDRDRAYFEANRNWVAGQEKAARDTAREAAEQGFKERQVGLAESMAGQIHATGLPGGGAIVTNPKAGTVNVVSPGTPGFGAMPAVPPRTQQVYPQPKAPAAGGAQVDRMTGAPMGGPLPVEAGQPTAAVTPPRAGLMDMISSGAENVGGALGLEGVSQIPAALGDLITRDPKEVEKAARSRARYMVPGMQRTF
jgi:hypothetical protein